MTSGAAGLVPSAPLTPRGWDQAAVAARGLADGPIAEVYASTALRAGQTAGAIAIACGVNVFTPVAELGEVGIGRAEGSVDPQLRKRTADVLRAWVVDEDLDLRVEDGETGHEVVVRMTSALEGIVAAHPGETVVVVGHVASLTIALSRLCGLGDRVWGTPLPHAEPFLVEWDGQGWNCETWPAPTPTL